MLGTPYNLPYVMQCEALHFASSALAAWLVFFLILTICYRAFPELATSRRSWSLSLCAGAWSLCAAIGIHWYADLAAWGF